ncbi:cobalamin-binding protein [Saccharospirillum salsuginis]|uniref:Cobalamin-binding protein n=1 Tax=Saccharospirillum salsuginis TaxID=418750 RepID=A0A918N8G4_9GAMM|nr:cobalamin-binding protein [Saccharospirillum salsuginis]GGX48338.1 cobalamin-binding protein [Saccharospirillum salsuginis]
MNRLFCLLFGLLLPLTGLAEITLTDDTGQDITLDEPAQRVITLVPHATELMFEIGAGDRIIATVDYSDYPKAARDIQRIGDYNALNQEAIIDLKPDLLIAFTSGPAMKDVEQLKRMGLTVFHSDPQTFTTIADALRDFGRLTGLDESANDAATTFETAIGELGSRYGDRETLSVFYEVWHDPIYTLNGESFISDIIDLCGGRNVFADLPVISPQISLEAVFEQDPQVIVTGPVGNEAESPWTEWPQLQAVNNNALVTVDPDTMHRPTPSLLIGAGQLCRDLDRLRSEVY